jgi:hypothetical protein
MRWAGEALQFLGDNALTRGWSDGVTNLVIQPAEVAGAELARLVGMGAGADAMVGQDTRVRLARRMVEDLTATGGKLSPETVAILQERVDPAFDVGRYEGAVRVFDNDGASFDERVLRVAEALRQGDYAPGTEPSGVIRQQTDALRHAVNDGSARAYTAAGEPVRQYLLGSPVAAYGATGAGLGAVGLGLAQLLGQAQEPPAEPERKPKKEKKPEER